MIDYFAHKIELENILKYEDPERQVVFWKTPGFQIINFTIF